MTKPKKKGQDGHNISRAKICIVCFKRSNKNVSANQLKGLKEHSSILDSISPEDSRVPTGICHGCSTTLQLKINGKAKDQEFKVPTGFSFQTNVIVSKVV